MNFVIDASSENKIRLWDATRSDIPKEHPYISNNEAYYKELKISKILWQYAADIFEIYGYKIEFCYLGKLDNPWNVRWHIVKDYTGHDFFTATEAFEYLESVIKD